MTIDAEGTVYGDTIKLDGAIDLPEGSRVSVRIEKPKRKLTLEERREVVKALTGSTADDPTFAEAMEQVVRERRRFVPREPREIDEQRMREGFERGFGACKDDPTVAEVFAQIERERHMRPPREVEPFDQAS